MTDEEMVRHDEVYQDWQDCIEFIRLFLKRFGEDPTTPDFVETEEMLDKAYYLIERAKVDEMEDESLDKM